MKEWIKKHIGEYILSFYYEDIFANKYMQEFDVTIEYNTEKNRPVVIVDMSHTQEILEEKTNG